MLIDIENTPALDLRAYSSIPRVGVNVKARFKAGEAEILLEEAPASASGEDIIFISYSLICLYKGEVKAVVSLEKTDLRSLANSLGESIRTLQKEYSTRGFFDQPRVVVYGADERQEYGEFTEEEKEEFVLPYLMDILLDIIDSADDPVRI